MNGDNRRDDDDGASVPDLTKQFFRDSEPFLTSDSSRATRLGQVWCRCDDPAHTVHRPRECGWDVFKDDYCRECYAFVFGSAGGA